MAAIKELEIRVPQPSFKERKKPTFHPINCGKCGELTEVTGTRQKFCRPCAKEIKVEQDKLSHSDPKYGEKHRESDKLSHKEGRKRQRESRSPSKAQELQIKRLEREMKIAAKNPSQVQKILGTEPLFTVGETGIPVYFSLKEKPHFSFRYGGSEFSFDARSAVEHYKETPYQKLRKFNHPNPNRLKK